MKNNGVLYPKAKTLHLQLQGLNQQSSDHWPDALEHSSTSTCSPEIKGFNWGGEVKVSLS